MCFLCKITFNSVEIPHFNDQGHSGNRRKSKHLTAAALLTGRSSCSLLHDRNGWEGGCAMGPVLFLLF